MAGLMSELKIPSKQNNANLFMKHLSAEGVHWRHMATLVVNMYPKDIGLDEEPDIAYVIFTIDKWKDILLVECF